MAIQIPDGVVETGRKLGLGRIPGVRRVYRTVSQSSGYDSPEAWLQEKNLEYKTISYRGAAICCPAKYYQRWNDGIDESRVEKCLDDCVEPGATVFDIGGHLGIHTVTMRDRVGSEGRVFTFEPIPQWVSYLRETVSQNKWDNVTIEPMIVSDTIGERELSVKSPETSQSSILKEYAEGAVVTAQSATVSDYCDKKGIDTVEVSKMDIEGGEYHVICRSNALDYIETLIVEIHPSKMGEEKAREVIIELQDTGTVTALDGSELVVDQDGTTIHALWRQ